MLIFFANKKQYMKDFPKIVFTGMIDEFFDYKLGELEYRSLRFEMRPWIWRITKEMQLSTIPI